MMLRGCGLVLIALALAPLTEAQERGQPLPDPGAHLYRGREAFHAGPLTEALEEARRAVARAPSSVRSLLALGRMAEFLGEFDEAQEAYTRAAGVWPDDQEVLYRSASVAFRIGDSERALALLDRILTNEPWWARRIVQYAPVILRRRLAGGQAAREAVLQLKVDILLEAGDLEGARRLARESGIVRSRRDYCGEARERIRGSSTGAIITELRLATLAQPDAVQCIWWFGQWLTEYGYARMARPMIMEGNRLAPNPSLRASGEMYLRVRLSDSRDVAKRAEQLSLFGLHRYLRDGDVEGAVPLLQAAIRLDSGFPRPYLHLARIAWDQGDGSAAVAWLEKAVLADPSSWRTHRNLGKALDALGRHSDAERSFRKALELFEHDVGSQVALARILYAQRKFKQYETLTEEALRFAENVGVNLHEVRDFLKAYRQTGPGTDLPPAPDPSVSIGWNRD